MTITPLPEQRERLLRAITTGFLVLIGLVALVDLSLWLTMPVGSAIYGTDLCVSLVIALAGGGVWALARRERYELAAGLLVTALAVRTIFTVGVVAPEKIAIFSPGYLVVIVLAQILLGSRGGVIAGLGSLPMFALAYANLSERTDVIDILPETAAAAVFVYVTVGGFVEMALRYMEQALRRSNVLLLENERARRELQESVEQFRALAESSPTGIVIQQDGHLVYGNPRFAEMARCVQRDVFGLSLWDFFGPEGASALKVQLERRRQAGGNYGTPNQLVFKPLKGASVYCEVALADAVYKDRDAIVANVLDVSERVTAQLEVQRERDFSNNIINAADAIIMALDAEGNIVRFNPAGERIMGYAESELTGRPYWAQMVPRERHGAARQLIHATTPESPRGEVEAVWVTRTGEERTIAWRYVAQLSPDKQVSGLIAVGIDVTQQRILEQQAMAAERLRALGQMAGGVAHDLNNTLAGILGPTELMLLEEQDPERRQELTSVAAAARRGAETVRRIQRFSQARTDLDRQEFNLHNLVEDVIHTLRPRWRDQAQRQGITIAITDDVSDDLQVVGSAGEIGNVITNLIVNACEAMPAGGEIAIVGHQKGDVTVFSVTDTGCGIPADMVENIFQPFFSTKGADNSGLGLAVMRGIVLRHGGNIEVSSQVGVGTTFTVSLPAAPTRAAKEASAAAHAEPGGAFRFLVVDDTPAIADFAGVALRKMGHEVTIAYTSDDALGRLGTTAFDVLLTDYGMEGLSGLGLAQEAKRIHPHIKTVIMTGWDFAEGEFEGVDASLAKPFTLAQLGTLIDEKLVD